MAGFENETPEAVTSVLGTALGYLSAYGWHLLFFFVIVNLIWSHFKPKFQQWQDRRRSEQLAAEYQHNPDRLIAMQESLALARQRMQEEHDRLAREHAEKLKQMEEEKRQEKIKKWQCIQAGSSFSAEKTKTEAVPESSSKQPKPKHSETHLRGQDYNPLTGSGSGACYRPSRRGGGGSGGG